MYDESQPTPEPTPSPAREGQETNEGEGSGQNGQDQSQDAGKKDDAQVNNSGNPPPPPPPAPAKPAKPTVKRPYVKPRTPEQKALDDAIEAHQKTALAIEAAREKLASAGRAKALKKGREVVIAGIEHMSKGQLEALVGMLSFDAEEDRKAVQDYLVALQENAEIAAKKLADGPKQG